MAIRQSNTALGDRIINVVKVLEVEKGNADLNTLNRSTNKI